MTSTEQKTQKTQQADVWAPKEIAPMSLLLKELLSVTYGDKFFPESICSEIAEYANCEWQITCDNVDFNMSESLIFPSGLVRFAMCNPFGFTVFASIKSTDEDGFDGVILDIEEALTIRLNADNKQALRIYMPGPSEELYLTVDGYKPNTEYILAFSFLKLENRKYILMVRELNQKLTFRDEENDEENNE